MVERNLAKVDVARSNRVTRLDAFLVELVDTLVLGTSASGMRVRVPRKAFFNKDNCLSIDLTFSLYSKGLASFSNSCYLIYREILLKIFLHFFFSPA